MKIGFIGLGLMGRAMVECLQKAGFDLTVLGNRDRTGVEEALGDPILGGEPIVAVAWLYHRPLLAVVLLLTAGAVAVLSAIAIVKIVKRNREAPTAA